MQTKSRDGRFIISASDSSKTGSRIMTNGETEETKFDKENDVYLEALEEVDLVDVSRAITLDCFDFDTLGLHLLAKILHCHVTVGNKTYHFTVSEDLLTREEYVLEEIATQLKL